MVCKRIKKKTVSSDKLKNIFSDPCENFSMFYWLYPLTFLYMSLHKSHEETFMSIVVKRISGLSYFNPSFTSNFFVTKLYFNGNNNYKRQNIEKSF